MIPPRLVRRLFHIQRILVHHGLDDLVGSTHRLHPLQYAARLTPGFRDRELDSSRGVRIRRALEDLGPIFVKFGQALSTRRDLLPEDIAEELVKLQDRVPPFPGVEARRAVETALGRPVEELFLSFDEYPLASASVAQVHGARLKDGQEVVVKVLRPRVQERIRADIELLYALAGMAERFWPDARRLRPTEVVAEFEKTILDELDLVREAANATEIRRRFENSDLLYVPKVHWDYTRREVMVMERISGIPIGDVDRLKRERVDLKTLAERGVEIFFTQVFRDSFFHADMHPGNIFATPDARYIAVDFGIVGSISKTDQYYVAENLLAFFNRDYRRIAIAHVDSGWVPRTTRIEDFESAVRSVCEPIFEKPLKEISYGHLLLRLFQVARRFDMEVQPQLVLLQKTLLNIEGLGRELYPDLDLWQTAKPFLERWFKEEMGPQGAVRKLRTQIPGWIRQWPEVPDLSYRLLERAAKGKLELEIRSNDLHHLRQELRRESRRLLGGLTASAFLVSAAVLVTTSISPFLTGFVVGCSLLSFLYAWVWMR